MCPIKYSYYTLIEQSTAGSDTIYFILGRNIAVTTSYIIYYTTTIVYSIIVGGITVGGAV